MNKKEIAKLITQRRKQLNITQVELALLSELSTRQLSDIETAKVSPELRDSIIARYGFFKEHEEFESSVRLIDTIDGSPWSVNQLGTFNYEPGAFILRVQRTGISDRCVPFINLGDDNEE